MGRGGPRRGGHYAPQVRVEPIPEADGFVKLYEEVAANVQTMNTNVQSLRKLTEQIGTPRDTQKLRESLHAVNELTKKIAHDTASDFEQLQILAQSGNATTQKQRRLVLDRLRSNFQQVIEDYTRNSQQAAVKQRQFVAIAKRRTEARAWEPSSPPADERTSLLAQERQRERMQHQALDQEIQFNDMLIKDREDSIREIESTIVEINSLFKDLAQTVTQQQDMIDNIETNLEQAADRTEAGVGELQKASEYQRSYRTKICCCLLILLIIGAVIALIVVLTRK